MPAVEVVIRLHNSVVEDVEVIQEAVLDSLYKNGFHRVEPIRATLVEDEDNSHC